MNKWVDGFLSLYHQKWKKHSIFFFISFPPFLSIFLRNKQMKKNKNFICLTDLTQEFTILSTTCNVKLNWHFSSYSIYCFNRLHGWLRIMRQRKVLVYLDRHYIIIIWDIAMSINWMLLMLLRLENWFVLFSLGCARDVWVLAAIQNIITTEFELNPARVSITLWSMKSLQFHRVSTAAAARVDRRAWAKEN